jgi:putative FmdB family regulatory protein
MPIYEYKCEQCHLLFEVKRHIGEDGGTPCPQCESEARRIFSPIPIIFKGPGFYVTDNQKPPPSGDGKKTQPSDDDKKPPPSSDDKKTQPSDHGKKTPPSGDDNVSKDGSTDKSQADHSAVDNISTS